MFSFATKKSQTPVDPVEFLKMISDKTAPNFFWTDDTRIENRNNRTIPVTISPWGDGYPKQLPVRMAVTKDISCHGVCIVSTVPITKANLVLGMFIKEVSEDEPLFFKTDVAKVASFGQGLWQVGLKVTELLNTNFPDQMESLIPLAIDMLTPKVEA